jgi:hypothetical protein
VFKFPDRIVYLCGLLVKAARQNFQAVLVEIGQERAFDISSVNEENPQKQPINEEVASSGFGSP